MNDLVDLNIQFLVRFAQMDLDTLRPGDWLNLRDDLQRFLRVNEASHGDLVIEGVLPEHHQSDLIEEGLSVEEYPEEAFRTLQTAVRTLLHQIAITSGDTPVEPFAAYVHLSADFRLVRAQTGRKARDHCVLLVTSGPVRDAFLLMTLFLLSRPPFTPIARCPECGKIFYRRDKRQKFCERRCANLAGTKRFYRRKKSKKGKKHEKSQKTERGLDRPAGPGWGDRP